MTRLVLLLAGLGLTAGPGCSSCHEEHRDAGAARRPPSDAEPPPPPGIGKAPRRGDGGPARGDGGGADAGRPAHPPQVVAQRFLVGWASGRFDGLDAMSAERAGELVRRAIAGEMVETPIGAVGPDTPRASGFSFGAMRLAPIREGVVQVTLTATLRYREGPPVTSEQSLVIRLSDGVVLDWISPERAGTPDGGV